MKGIRLGRFFGIDVSSNLGVLVIAAFLTWTLASAILPAGAPGHVEVTYWSIAFVISLLFIASLLAHELAHSIIARRNNVKVEGITLWLFGGVSQFESDPETPGAEFRITAAGPATSLAIGGLGVAAAYGLQAVGGPVVYSVALAWFGMINLFLGAFNLIPGAPLDGGRLLAAAIWKVTGNRLTGHIGAARAGRVVGGLIAALGFAEIYLLKSGAGLWTIFVGWFLYAAARSELTHYAAERSLGDLTVSAAMVTEPQTASSLMTVAQVADGILASGHQSVVPILDWNGHLMALVDMADLQRIPKSHWESATAMQAVRDGSSVSMTTPGERLTDLVLKLARHGDSHAAVMADEKLVGVIGTAEIERAVARGARGTTRTGGTDLRSG